MSGTREYCTFEVEGHRLGLDVNRIEEILRPGPRCEVPLSPGHVQGLCNLRGDILVVWDLRRVLGLPGTPSEECVHVVVRQGQERIALAVDSVGDVVQLDPAELIDTPTNVPDPLRALLAGVCLHHQQLLLVLDADRTLATANSGLEV